MLTALVSDTLGDLQPGGEILEFDELINTRDQTFDLCALAERALR